ncbi:hypothetical protein BJY52DRAFT_1388978 [Lactarius psammicola]|nr:hypothetical protein BJY52DRAFT_1388978 [Lactarius psammicola]
MLCMNPLDLLEVKFQLSMRGPEGGIGHNAPCATYTPARDDAGYITGWTRILQSSLSNNTGGRAGLVVYLIVLLPARLNPNLQIRGYNQLKRRATVDAPRRPPSASQYLLFSTDASAMTVVFTNPIWVVKSPDIHRAARLARGAPGVAAAWYGPWTWVSRDNPRRGWALLRHVARAGGVSNGAMQFMAYEQTKS